MSAPQQSLPAKDILANTPDAYSGPVLDLVPPHTLAISLPILPTTDFSGNVASDFETAIQRSNSTDSIFNSSEVQLKEVSVGLVDIAKFSPICSRTRLQMQLKQMNSQTEMPPLTSQDEAQVPANPICDDSTDKTDNCMTESSQEPSQVRICSPMYGQLHDNPDKQADPEDLRNSLVIEDDTSIHERDNSQQNSSITMNDIIEALGHNEPNDNPADKPGSENINIDYAEGSVLELCPTEEETRELESDPIDDLLDSFPDCSGLPPSKAFQNA
ncbi:hypothetical protein AVEN_214767-1, partial [Araneus ventricosus]